MLPAGSERMLPPAPLGIPLLDRIRNASRAARHESYIELEEAINRRLVVLREQVRLQAGLIEDNAYLSGRLSKRELIKERGALEVEEELGAMRHAARVRAMQQDLEMLQLEAQLTQARGGRSEPTEEPRNQNATRLEAVFAEVQEMNQAFDDRIADIIRTAGGEDALTEEDHRHIDFLREMKTRSMAELYEAMGR